MISSIQKDSPQELTNQRALWRRQAAAIPALRGGKNAWFPLILTLMKKIGSGETIDLETQPDVPAEIFTRGAQKQGARPLAEPSTWLEYSKFLKAVGIASTANGSLNLTPIGQTFLLAPSPESLGLIMTDRFRLLAESLSLISEDPLTVEELDAIFRNQYDISWKSLGGTRSRLDWLSSLELIEGGGNRKWKITESGNLLLNQCTIVTPQAIAIQTAPDYPIIKAPNEIQNLLQELLTGERTHESRSTYNIWVPSPAEKPNKVENLRCIINAAIDPIGREEFLEFITETFTLRRSSVDSMMPFLRASGLLHEVGLGIYQATAPALAWVVSGDDVNFIRILHANMRFVGEMLQTAGSGITRAEMYKEASKFGLNVDKSRWIASFMENAGLIEQHRYGSIRATTSGLTLIAELPLALAPIHVNSENITTNIRTQSTQSVTPSKSDELMMLSQSPLALSQNSGKAFENAIRDSFRAIGFHADALGGAGETDIVVRWQDETGAAAVAIIEAKSRSNGQITHTDISDVALETHKSKHQANFAAVIGPAFAGDTIKNMAAKRKWALIDSHKLGEIVDASAQLGLSPKDVGLLFKVPNGLDELNQIIKQRRRDLSIVSFVMAQLVEEAADTGDAITARDISRDGRRTELHPTVDEVLSALSILTNTAAGAIRIEQTHNDTKFSSYVLGDVRAAAIQLRALADAIEISLPETT